MSSEMNRRSFLKGAACGSAMVAAGATTAFAAPVDSIEWNEEADVVVLGLGFAGIGAITAAQERGLSVIVVEKMDRDNVGGASACNGGLLNPKSADYLEFMSYGNWDRARCEDMAQRILDASDWMGAMCPSLAEFEYNGTMVKRASNCGIELYSAVMPQIEELEGVTVEFETKAERLVVNPDSGEVLGVVVSTASGESAIKANKAVVIATGGYEDNKDMFRSLHYPLLPYSSCAGPSRTGDGIMIGGAVGAKIGNIAQGVEWIYPSLRKASEEVGTAVLMAGYGVGNCIMVNAAGKRFDNENRNLTHSKSSLPMVAFYGEPMNAPDHSRGYANLPMWAVLDAEMFAAAPLAERGPWTWANTHGFAWGEDNAFAVEKGWVVEADTLEELAAKMVSTNIWGDEIVVDAQGLIETVERYNGFAESGEDEDFGRPDAFLQALVTPPFYAVELLPSVVYTCNGLVIDEESRVLDWNDNYIPRLYAAGDVGQGVQWTPMGLCGCWAEGQIAAEHIAELSDWDA